MKELIQMIQGMDNIYSHQQATIPSHHPNALPHQKGRYNAPHKIEQLRKERFVLK
jgi:hypothetical protein